MTRKVGKYLDLSFDFFPGNIEEWKVLPILPAAFIPTAVSVYIVVIVNSFRGP